MDERLAKQWRLTEGVLRFAADEIEGTEEYKQCRHYLDHNEFELALDVLEEAGEERQVSRDYWWHLKKAAEIMGLSDRYATLTRRVREAGAGSEG